MEYEDQTGMFGTGFWGEPTQEDVSLYDRKYVLDMSDGIQYIESLDTPFFFLLSQIGKEPAKQARFNILESEEFAVRSIPAKFCRKVSASNDESVVYLKLTNPRDAMALAAPPYRSNAAGYSADDGKLVYAKVMRADAITEYFHCIFEKHAVANAGKWRTVEPDVIMSDIDQTDLDVTGHVIMMGYAKDDEWDGSVSASALYDWHQGTYNLDECYVMGTDIDDTEGWSSVLTDNAAGFFSDLDTAGTEVDVYVEIFTPNTGSGDGYYEGSGIPVEFRRQFREDFNFVQLYKTSLSLTGTELASQNAVGNTLQDERREKGNAHKKDIDYSFMFRGARSGGTAGDESRKYKTRGLGIGKGASLTDLGYLKTHNVDLWSNSSYNTHATPTIHEGNPYLIENDSTDFYNHLSDACERIFHDLSGGSNTKIMFGSQKWKGAFTKNATASSAWSYQPELGQDAIKWGFRVSGYSSPYGDLVFMYHPAFRGMWENYAVILDFANIKMKTLRDSRLVTNAQNNDEDRLAEYYLTEAGLWVAHEHTMGVLKLMANND